MKSCIFSRALLISVLFVIYSFGNTETGQKGIQLKFHSDHTFKIAQFTDLHWNNNSVNRFQTANTIRMVLETEKPDLAILTGDIVTSPPAKEGWLAVSEIFSDAGIPWAVTLGNHDGETGITGDQIFELLSSDKLFIGSSGPEMYGCGNYSIPILSSDGKSVAAVIYCLDSGNHPEDKTLGDWDWIHFDQIDWYRKTSDKYTMTNNGTPVPSLMFFHIPLPEFINVIGKDTAAGVNKEGVSSSKINSGLFASLLEKKDVMGVFSGHNHDNDNIGTDHKITMAFGQVTGADAYGSFERGSRIIEIHEGKPVFSSWIRTKSQVSFRFQ